MKTEFAVVGGLITEQVMRLDNGNVIKVVLERPQHVFALMCRDGEVIEARSLHATETEALQRMETEMREPAPGRGKLQ